MSGSAWPTDNKWTRGVEWKEKGYNNSQKSNMSSMILCIMEGKALIGSDSRFILNKKKALDCMPKIIPYKNGLIGIVGLSYYKGEIFGEKLKGEDVFEAAEELMKELKDLPTEIIAVEYKEGIQCMIYETEDGLSYPALHGWRIFGVKHSLHCDKLDYNTISPETCRELIKADEECEKILKAIPTVGGPVQMYMVSNEGIDDLSDEDAPKGFEEIRRRISDSL